METKIDKVFRVPPRFEDDTVLSRVGIVLAKMAYGKLSDLTPPPISKDRKQVRIPFDTNMILHLGEIVDTLKISQNDAINIALIEISNNQTFYGVTINETKPR